MGLTNCDSPGSEGGSCCAVEVTIIVPVVGIIGIVVGIGVGIGVSVTDARVRIRIPWVGCRSWRHRR